MYKGKIRISLSIIVGLFTFAGIIFANTQKLFADKEQEPDKPEVIQPACYYVAYPIHKKPSSPQLIQDQELLEILYKQGKINKKTYDSRMKKINDQLKQLDAEPKSESEEIKDAGSYE